MNGRGTLNDEEISNDDKTFGTSNTSETSLNDAPNENGGRIWKIGSSGLSFRGIGNVLGFESGTASKTSNGHKDCSSSTSGSHSGSESDHGNESHGSLESEIVLGAPGLSRCRPRGLHHECP